MLKENTAYTSNCFKTLTELQGEKIKGVVTHYDNGHNHWVLIFESGFGLEVGSNGSYWVVTKDDMKSIIHRLTKELKSNVEQLGYVLEMAGED
jgi:hypothetical protein